MIEKEMSTAAAYRYYLDQWDKSNKYAFTLIENIQQIHPLHSFFEMGCEEKLFGSKEIILEAAGQALLGKTVFIPTNVSPIIAIEAFNEIRTTIAIPKLRVRIVSVHDGIEQAQAGALCQSYEDLGIMRILPNMAVLVPSDIISLKYILEQLMTSPLAAYIKLSDTPSAPLYPTDDTDFTIGGARFLREGESITLCVCGIMMREVLYAAEVLKHQGIEAEIIDCYSIKPFPDRILLSSIRKTGCCVVVEKHSMIGGLYSAVTECISRTYPVPVRYVAIEDHFGQSGMSNELDEYHGLSCREIVHNAVQVLAMRRR